MMQEAPNGPFNISSLAKATGMPRSTIHRHLKEGYPTRAALAKYAEVLSIDVERLEVLTGFNTTPDKDSVCAALAQELMQLDEITLDALWQLAGVTRRLRAVQVGRENGLSVDPAEVAK